MVDDGKCKFVKREESAPRKIPKDFQRQVVSPTLIFFPTRPSWGCNQFKRRNQAPIVYLPNDFGVLQQVELMNIYREQVNDCK